MREELKNEEKKKNKPQMALLRRARKLCEVLKKYEAITTSIRCHRQQYMIIADIAKTLLPEIKQISTAIQLETVRAAISFLLAELIDAQEREKIQEIINEAKQAKRIHAIRENHPSLFQELNNTAQERWRLKKDKNPLEETKKRREVSLASVEKQGMKAFSKEEIQKVLDEHTSLPKSKNGENKWQIIANIINEEFHDNESVRSMYSMKNCYERYNGRDLELVFTSSQSPQESPPADSSVASPLGGDQPTLDDPVATASADQED